jgi:hypothetical protein
MNIFGISLQAPNDFRKYVQKQLIDTFTLLFQIVQNRDTLEITIAIGSLLSSFQFKFLSIHFLHLAVEL